MKERAMKSGLVFGITVGLLFVASSGASAQDIDGDGIADAVDMCLMTPRGTSVDPAGCASVCDAQRTRGGVFARTLLTELGLMEEGATFGASVPASAGYHPRSTSGALGIVANPERDGWVEYDGDFIEAGRREAGWGMTVGTQSLNNMAGQGAQIRGGFARIECVASGLCGRRGGARAHWQAEHPAGLIVEHEAVLLHEGLFVTMNVTLRNVTDGLIRDVHYFRTVAPNNNTFIHGHLGTRNTVESQLPPLGSDAQALVSGVQDAAFHSDIMNPAYIALVSRERSAVVSHGGFGSRSARNAHEALPPFVSAVGASREGFDAINIAFRFDIPALGVKRFTYVIALDPSALTDAFRCADVDSDGDGVVDAIDIDDDDDGVPDALEVFGFAGDPSADTDGDGVPDWRDPDHVPGGCVDASPADGVCDALPSSIDTDGDGNPDHLDLDADGDGLTDALESGGPDADGDGQPDGCVRHSAVGGCETAGGASLLVSSVPDTDGDGGPDLRDLDSDGDGIGDRDEAFDMDGDGVGDVLPTGNDADGDGIDDAYDPDSSGAPVTLPLAMYRDADGDGIGDWLEVCGDGYVTAGEVCDTGADRTTCSAACLKTGMQPCRSDGECDSMRCDPASNTCVPCKDTTSGGIDDGCTAKRPICIAMSCEVCDDTAAGAAVDEGCSAAAPECDVTTRTCGPCTDPSCLDAGMPDAGAVDAGVVDGGVPGADAGAFDGGASGARPVGSGLSCAAHPGRGHGAPLFVLAALALGWRRLRRR